MLVGVCEECCEKEDGELIEIAYQGCREVGLAKGKMDAGRGPVPRRACAHLTSPINTGRRGEFCQGHRRGDGSRAKGSTMNCWVERFSSRSCPR